MAWRRMLPVFAAALLLLSLTAAENETNNSCGENCSDAFTPLTLTEVNASVLVSPSKGATGFAVVKSRTSAAFGSVLGLGLGVQVFLGVVAAAILYGAYARMKDTPENNFRHARHHHRLANEAHGSGDEEKAQQHYQAADAYRQKALEKNEVV